MSEWFDTEFTTFGDRLTGAREAAGLKPSELAERLGVRERTIRSWENDQAEPRANRLGMLAGMLGVSMMWLISGEGDGLEGGAEMSEAVDADMNGILSELRQTRIEQAEMAERIHRLERRLRLALARS